jgi:stringent starvation protein B
MMDASESSSTRPYLIRAMYEWCTDNGFTPYVAVSVNDRVQVPREFVQNGEIVLNIGFDATSSLKLGNEFIEFKARFSGTAREIMVPVAQVMAIYARENGQGMAFPAGSSGEQATSSSPLAQAEEPQELPATQAPRKPAKLAKVESETRNEGSGHEPPHPSAPSSRPSLTRIK